MSIELRCRFVDPMGEIGLGWLEGDRVRVAQGSWIGDLSPTGVQHASNTVRFLAPVAPSKIVAAATNYRPHALEMNRPIPQVPKIFLKAVSAIIGPGRAVEIPPGTDRVDPEAEVALVIGRRLQRVSASEAVQGVLGVMPLNDVTARDLQRSDGVFSRAKGFDTFCPMGPAVGIGLDLDALEIVGRVNGETRQRGNTRELIFDCGRLVSFISHVMTLEPGDVIATGTPSGVAPIHAGDTLSVEIEGLPILENPVTNRSDRV